MTDLVNRLIDVTDREWDFFGNGEKKLDGTTTIGKKEYHDGAWQRVADYWKFIGGPYKNVTGKDRNIPWSAAFVSFCFNEAGAGDRFPYSAGHATYINRAIRNTNGGGSAAPIMGRRIQEYALKPGDLICAWRGSDRITYDTARAKGSYPSHCDIVVEVGDRKAYAIGGNVEHSVLRREVRLNGDGIMTDRSNNWFAIIENRL